MQILNCKQAIVVGGPRWVLEGEGGGGGGTDITLAVSALSKAKTMLNN